jgi:hypothetical protein
VESRKWQGLYTRVGSGLACKYHNRLDVTDSIKGLQLPTLQTHVKPLKRFILPAQGAIFTTLYYFITYARAL